MHVRGTSEASRRGGCPCGATAPVEFRYLWNLDIVADPGRGLHLAQTAHGFMDLGLVEVRGRVAVVP